MCGTGAHHAEVVLRLDDTLAEIRLPHAIDGYASRQRVRRIDQPLRQVEAIALHRLRGEYGGNAGIDSLAVLEEVATDLDVGLARCGQFLHDQGSSHPGLRPMKFGRAVSAERFHESAQR